MLTPELACWKLFFHSSMAFACAEEPAALIVPLRPASAPAAGAAALEVSVLAVSALLVSVPHAASESAPTRVTAASRPAYFTVGFLPLSPSTFRTVGRQDDSKP